MSHFSSLTLFVVRHGQTEHNVEGRWTGRDDSPLTELGRHHARASGRVLKSLADDLNGLDFVASPLHRACVSMELLREAAGLPALGYRTDRRLMENDCGEWSSLSIHEIREHHSEHYGRRLKMEWEWAARGGQSQAAQFEEIGLFLKTLTRDSVLVCHGLTSRLVRAQALHLSPSAALGYELHNTGIVRLSNGEESFFDE